MTKLAGGPGRGVALPLSANEASAILYLASSVGSKFHALVTPFGGRDLSSSAEFCRWRSSSSSRVVVVVLQPSSCLSCFFFRRKIQKINVATHEK